MQPTAVKRDRTLIAIVSVILVIVVIAVVVVFTRGGPAIVDPATPEGVVQTYTGAVIDGDRAAAKDLLTSQIRENCESSDPYVSQDLRMTVVSSKIKGDTAIVRVTMSYGTGSGMLGDTGYSSGESFTLVRDGDSWRIESSPWDLMVCFNQGAGK